MEFGELNITSSRAFWDDYENVDEDQQSIEQIDASSFEWIFSSIKRVQWKWSPDRSIDDFNNLKSFVILEGERIRSQINQDNVSNIFPICHLSHQKVFIYMLKETNTAICLSEETNLNAFGIIAESIADLMSRSSVDDVNVVTVSVLPISSYKIGVDENLDAGIIIRGLNPGTHTVSELMEPNLLTGISAAVASHRHHLNKSFTSYAIYKDSHKTNFIGSPALIQFFEAIGIRSNIFYDSYPNESSLYT